MNQASPNPSSAHFDRSEPGPTKPKPGDLILAIPGHDVALTREQAAIRLGCDVDRISELLDEGKIARFWREGKRIMMWLSDVDNYIKEITERRSCLPSLLPKRRLPGPSPEILTPVIPKRFAISGDIPPLRPVKIRQKRAKRNSEMKGRLE